MHACDDVINQLDIDDEDCGEHDLFFQGSDEESEDCTARGRIIIMVYTYCNILKLLTFTSAIMQQMSESDSESDSKEDEEMITEKSECVV